MTKKPKLFGYFFPFSFVFCRWLPFEFESIDSPREHPFDYEGIYSQAYALYQQSFRFWFSQQEIMDASRETTQLTDDTDIF